MEKYKCIGCSKKFYFTEEEYNRYFINHSNENQRVKNLIICFDCFNPDFRPTLERIPNLDRDKDELDKISKKNKKIYKNERMYKMIKEIYNKSLNL